MQRDRWRTQAARIWSAPRFPHKEATDLLLEIARLSVDPMLSQVAKQALPNFRAPDASRSDPFIRDVAKLRFSAVHRKLTQQGSSFGRRHASSEDDDTEDLSEDQIRRRSLGLPLHGRLSGFVIRDGFRRQSKLAHPDLGGDPAKFIELVTARDALLAQLA